MADLKNFKLHRPIDPSDPGFTIPGARLRWLSGRVQEVSESKGYWTIIRKSQLDKKLVEHIQNAYPGAFADGDTVRRGSSELVLAYCDLDAANRLETEKLVKAKEQQTRSRIMPKQEYVGSKDYAKIEQYEESASTIPRQFLNKNEE